MYLEQLELLDFRSYPGVTLDLAPGPNVLLGANAQGKTNFIEAVYYLAVGGSHRVASDAPLVRVGADAAVIRATARAAGRRLTVELELRPGGRNRARINGQPQARVRNAIGEVRSVLFAPEDLGLVRGDPGDRRRFLDELLGQRRPAYLAARQEYDRVLRQRTALLRSLRHGGASHGGASHGGASGAAARATLATWTDALARVGATLLAARIAAVHALAGPAAGAYRDLVTDSDDLDQAAEGAARNVRLEYELSTGRRIRGEAGASVPDPAALAEELREGLAQVADAEVERGVTLAGPHRDELLLYLDDLPAKGYASQGETWSLALALRLASRDVLADVGEEPVVLLDDVFAELDEHRRRRLADRCRDFEQVLVTAAVDADVPLRGPRHLVRRGVIVAGTEGTSRVNTGGAA